MAQKSSELEKDPLWYKHGVIYQCHVRAFYDSNGDGVGDFRGLTAKLDYLQDLGVSAIWLLPFYPSPLKDDGYDIADYYRINPAYGTLTDFKLFLREAHRRGLRVITELVINHTSDQHPWFQRSRRARPGSAWRDFYVWSSDPEKYKEARIIFKDFETSNWTWDPVADAYFWHRFYSHQPDLNFENPQVHREIFKALDFWLDMGVDGLRLDAVPYLYEEEGTNCENLPQTHAFLKKLRRHVDEAYGDRMLLAEANQWPEDAVAYFGAGKGDECHMAFHFPVMPRLFMAVRMEDRIPIVDILDQTPPAPETCQWALFLRNHDELTLEMVTDEERDFMYRVYATDPRARINLGIRRRLAPLLGNDRKRIELMNALLFSLPGTPVLYYGDEIGMGDNIYLGDRNGVRTPMHWSSDKNAGFSRCNPQGLFLPVIVDPEYHYESMNVEAQQANLHSLLWWMKRLLAARKRWRALGQGTIEFVHPDNRKVLAYIRRLGDETILVVANLSRFVQPVELELSAYKQCVPVELFGRNRFPVISENPYFLTLSPHAFFWFSLEPVERDTAQKTVTAEELPLVSVADRWESVFEDARARGGLEGVLQDYVRQRRWFGGKAREIKALSIGEAIPVSLKTETAFITFLKVDYLQEEPETYVLPLAFSETIELGKFEYPHLLIACLERKKPGTRGLLYDALGNREFCSTLLQAISRRRGFKSGQGELIASPTSALRGLREHQETPLEPVLGRAEQSNSAVIFGDKLLLKLFRRLEPGINPDLEIGRFLTSRRFPHVPPVAGALEYRPAKGDLMSVAILSGFVGDARDAWEYTLDTLGRYFERVQSRLAETPSLPVTGGAFTDWIGKEVPPHVVDTIGIYIESARLLGERTAGMHLALASDAENKDFAPEPFSPHYQRGLYQSMRNLGVQTMELLRRRLRAIPEDVRPEAEKVLSLEQETLRRFRAVADHPIRTMRIRVHGDYHLGQVLHTGKDFVIIDFEGEPARSLTERRIKRSPMRDVGGMLRSYHYAAFSGLYQQVEIGHITAETLPKFESWARYWSYWVCVTFLNAYLKDMAAGNLLPVTETDFRVLLESSLLEKAVYELAYELNNRPTWVKIPLQGILQLLEPDIIA